MPNDALLNWEVVAESGETDTRAKTRVVVVCYDRPSSALTLIGQLHAANFSERVDLLISIDGGERSNETANLLKKTIWSHGKLQVRRSDANLGLRRHVMACGNAVNGYEAIVMLEDDLTISPYFHQFTRTVLDYFGSDPKIAGMSLYAPRFNEMAELPFEPEPADSSFYFLQSAQSWGQIWTEQMWHGFKVWYDAAPSRLTVADDMPHKIYEWPDSSWKKYAMKYAAENRKTWVYPYISLTSNRNELGFHNKTASYLYEVSIQATEIAYRLSAKDALPSYDIFFEREFELSGGAAKQKIPYRFDLYATRKTVTGPTRLFTIRELRQKPIRSFGIGARPHERNVLDARPGNIIREYEIRENQILHIEKFPSCRPIGYYANLGWRDASRIGLSGFKEALRRRIVRFL